LQVESREHHSHNSVNVEESRLSVCTLEAPLCDPAVGLLFLDVRKLGLTSLHL
jgi:hypothetical protein